MDAVGQLRPLSAKSTETVIDAARRLPGRYDRHVSAETEPLGLSFLIAAGPVGPNREGRAKDVWGTSAAVAEIRSAQGCG
jgi:hypothetical protein